ncbi:MAG: AAA family ATPase [Nitriliruptorales bacterium]|nr:AAA family ATPase [Nitriliruptorales bacterium]
MAATSDGSAAAREVLEEFEDVHARDAVVLCVANQKGGVGKTTTAVSLGAALADEGLQILLVDLDPQGNATTGLGLRAQEGAPSTYRVLVERMDVEDAAEPTAVKGLHVLPSSLDLAGAEIELVPAFSRENRLKDALDAVRDLYDVVLIDCPPSLGLLTINALVAADKVLVPIQCEYYALEGLGQLMRTIKLVTDGLNDDLELGGVVLTMYDARTNLSQQVVDEVRDYFGEDAYNTIVPRTVRLSEAPSFGQPITVFDSSSRGARAYQRLAREVAARLGYELEEEVSPLDRLLGGPAPQPDERPDGAAPVAGSRTTAPTEATGSEEEPPMASPGDGRLPTDLERDDLEPPTREQQGRGQPEPEQPDSARSEAEEPGSAQDTPEQGPEERDRERPAKGLQVRVAEDALTHASGSSPRRKPSATAGGTPVPDEAAAAVPDERRGDEAEDAEADDPNADGEPAGTAGRAWWDQ